MKLYFHFNLGVAHDMASITAAMELENPDDKLDLKACLKDICKQLRESEKVDLDINYMEVSSSKKKAIPIETAISTLPDRSDLIVKVCDDANKSKVVYEKTMITKDEKKVEVKSRKSVNENSHDPEIMPLIKKAEQLLSRKRHDLALSTFHSILKLNSNNFDSLFGIAYIYFKAERYSDSLPYFEKVISKDSSNHVVLLDFARALTLSGDASKAVSAVSRCINDLKRANQPPSYIHDANVVLAEALERMDQLPNAFQIFLSISQMTDKQHVDGLLGYARVGYKLKHVTLDDVFIVVLNAVAQRKNDVKIQKYFTEMLHQKGGFDSLSKQMHEAWSDAPAVVYIATFLREYGALNECMRLLKHAFSLAPKSIDIALFIVHVHENLCLFDEGLAFAANFLDGKLDRQVVRKMDLSPVVKILRIIMKKDFDGLEELITKQLAPEKEGKLPSPKGPLANLELQLMALYFTIVKKCYINGHLRAIPVFLKLLEPLYKLNDDLHKTLIRNEQAYYSCISEIYNTCPPSVPSSNSECVYFVGDSHTLPVAWKPLEVNESEMFIHPVLVTGLKIWHLRKESTFYTKANFQNSLQQIPNGSICIFAFGEIDCREGVMRAVEKCVYDTLDDCMTSLVDIYVKCLLDVQKAKKLKILVHPVPPVLNETFKNVQKFNEHLKSRVVKTAKLFWLEFVDQLIDGGDGFLKQEYHFDGAHLHPKYVEVLQQSVEKHL